MIYLHRFLNIFIYIDLLTLGSANSGKKCSFILVGGKYMSNSTMETVRRVMRNWQLFSMGTASVGWPCDAVITQLIASALFGTQHYPHGDCSANFSPDFHKTKMHKAIRIRHLWEERCKELTQIVNIRIMWLFSQIQSARWCNSGGEPVLI